MITPLQTKSAVSSTATDPGVRLRVDEVYLGYGDAPVLRGISLALAPGEVVLVMGENGAGKSSLIRVLSGQIAPLRGRVELDGVRIDGLAPHQVHSRGISTVLQGGRVFGGLTVEDNLRVASQSGMDSRHSTATDLFPLLKPLRGRRASLLSGGERQMLAVSMALVRSPRVLLLDEPTAGLAGDLAGQCLVTVAQRTRALGAAVMLVEQNLDAAMAICDRALVLHDGMLIPFDAKDRVSTRGNLT